MKSYLLVFLLALTWVQSLAVAKSYDDCFIKFHKGQGAAAPDTLAPVGAYTRTDRYFADLLNEAPELLKSFLDVSDSLGVQIIYTRIDRDKNNNPSFTRYYYHVNPAAYFYPASTVKMPVALLALQKLNELKVFGLDEEATMISESGYAGQTPVYNDPCYEDGRPTIAGYIKKIFLVSDNDAFNRLYEFLGQQYINERLHAMGYAYADILHRLSVPLSEDGNRHTNPIAFYNTAGKSIYSQPVQVSTLRYPERTDLAGTAYYSGGKLVNKPMDFSRKNRLLLDDLTTILQSIVFPESVPQSQRFNLSEQQYSLVLRYMSQYPTETSFPALDSSMMYDGYGKFLVHGGAKQMLPKTLRLFNKEGDAYGFLTDIAYIADFEKNVEFMLSATIYCNRDGIINDDKYDYATIGLPFMKALGQYIYQVEANRKTLQTPDLSRFKFSYDR